MRIYRLRRWILGQLPYSNNAPIANTYISTKPRISTSVENSAIYDENIKLLGGTR